MYSLNKMGFNKPLCNNRQYGTNTLGLNHNMVLLKPEYLGNDHFKFLNNFGIQPHLITDKKFADVHSVKPTPRTFYPSNCTITSHRKPTETVKQVQVQDIVIPLPASTFSETCTKSEGTMGVANNKPCGSSKPQKKSKRKRKQPKREGAHHTTSCIRSPNKMRNVDKPWHKTSLKLEIVDMEDVEMETPETPRDVLNETLPINIIEPQSTQNCSPIKSPVRKLELCHQFRIPSECESEDSFIIFDNSSNSCDRDLDVLELDEFCYSSSADDEDDNDGICSIVSSLDDVWPAKRVRFADDKDLCEVHPMVQWSYAYQKARKGPWEQYALDRTRFQRRILDLESTLSNILQPEHRNKIYNERFVNHNL